MTTVVITGASGFLGQALLHCLANKGFSVIPVSRRTVKGMHQVRDYRESPKGDVLIHLAEEPDRGKVNRMGAKYLNDAAEVLRELSNNSYQRILYASSGVVYGENNEQPCNTSMSVRASDVYSESKLRNEKIVLDAGGIALRLSNLYGQGMSTNNVMSDIVQQVPGEGPLKVRDDMPVRDFLCITDAAAIFEKLITSNYCGLVNAGTGTGTSVRELAQLALSSAGQGDREIIATKSAAKQSINVLNIFETMRITGWSPAALLKDQLKELINDKEKRIHE